MSLCICDADRDITRVPAVGARGRIPTIAAVTTRTSVTSITTIRRKVDGSVISQGHTCIV